MLLNEEPFGSRKSRLLLVSSKISFEDRWSYVAAIGGLFFPSMKDASGDHTEKATCGSELRQRQKNPVVLPTYSSRTLHHPSFQSLYMAVGCTQCNWQAPGHKGITFPAMIPSDFFYTDPTLPPGSRVPNGVTQLETFECCQLNTPPPVMSITDSPPGLDPFRTRPHPTRDLGSQMWTWDTHSTFRSRTPQGQILEVIQMSSEEDEAITSLLKLHYQSQLDTTSSDPWGDMTAQDLTGLDHQSLSPPTPIQPSLSDLGPASNSVEGSVPSLSVLESQSMQGSDVMMDTSSVLFSVENIVTDHFGKEL
ncbi:hypothetical protein SKAU_G00371700 [Synaphobranchus kaupii]|uniref:Uncharacterized protein n=1 Tax=Synaphobranchus kaupii TaxID=118154 RepID=A0A9Q1IFZ8_SYNKA|nr:hypothetical protein SKAU_G00371700 [Synaphobranchus kaupii]